MHITTYSYYLKEDEKLCLKANLVRCVTSFVLLGIHSLAIGWPSKMGFSFCGHRLSYTGVFPAIVTFIFATNVCWLWTFAGPGAANVHTYSNQKWAEWFEFLHLWACHNLSRLLHFRGMMSFFEETFDWWLFKDFNKQCLASCASPESSGGYCDQ